MTMNDVVFDEKQSQLLGRAIIDDIKQYCENNFERFIEEYRAEVKEAKGQPIEPIRISFLPISYFSSSVEQSCIENDVRGNTIEGASQCQ